jgi:sugar phosphate isomerase/epimerase
MFFGYNTNGFAHHRLEDALAILAELGYEGVAITLDHQALNPFDPELHRQINGVRTLLRSYRLRAVIETGARFLLDSRRKHQPTLISPGPDERAYRLEFLERAVYIAAALESPIVSFWSGTPVDDAPPDVLTDRLVEGCQAIADIAAVKGVRLAFEPEPGMFIDKMDRFAALFERVSRSNFGLTLDVGHLHCLGEPMVENFGRWRDRLWNMHLEDMRRGVHEHLMFGEGEMDFALILRGLHEIDYRGGVFIELSRQSHDAVNTARNSLAFLRAIR